MTSHSGDEREIGLMHLNGIDQWATVTTPIYSQEKLS